MRGARRGLGEVRAVLALDDEPSGLYVRTGRLRSHAIVVRLDAIIEIDVEQRTVKVDEREVPELVPTAASDATLRQRVLAALGAMVP